MEYGCQSRRQGILAVQYAVFANGMVEKCRRWQIFDGQQKFLVGRDSSDRGDFP
jgi:hypothetical protein